MVGIEAGISEIFAEFIGITSDLYGSTTDELYNISKDELFVLA